MMGMHGRTWTNRRRVVTPALAALGGLGLLVAGCAPRSTPPTARGAPQGPANARPANVSSVAYLGARRPPWDAAPNAAVAAQTKPRADAYRLDEIPLAQARG